MKLGMGIVLEERISFAKYKPYRVMTSAFASGNFVSLGKYQPIWMKLGMGIVLEEGISFAKYKPDRVMTSAFASDNFVSLGKY